jgi:hypothetical protein
MKEAACFPIEMKATCSCAGLHKPHDPARIAPFPTVATPNSARPNPRQSFTFAIFVGGGTSSRLVAGSHHNACKMRELADPQIWPARRQSSGRILRNDEWHNCGRHLC